MQKTTRSILDELDALSPRRDRKVLVESRALHVIQSAVNLINYIKENFDDETANDLERRLLNSIRSQDSSKFVRGIKRANKNENR